MTVTAEQIERAKQLGWTVREISDSRPIDILMSYWVLMDPNGKYFAIPDNEDYGYGSGDSSPDKAWQRLPADLV